METLICLPFIIGVIWILINTTFLKKMSASKNKNLSISVLVPLRNEEKHVVQLMKNLRALDYEQVEFILYDDDSTDRTAMLIQEGIHGDSRFQLVTGDGLPEGWNGKPHACYELAKKAQGDVFLWIDADVQLAKNTLQLLSATMNNQSLDAVSGFPRFINSCLLERLLTPLLHFFIHMHLPIQLANNTSFTAATAASGAFIAVRKDVYFSIGGHEKVKDKVIEDVTLFKEIKRSGFRTNIIHIADLVSCTMYENTKETWRGFEKNCFKAFKESYARAATVVIFYLFYYVLPVPLAIWSVLTNEYIYVLPLLCILLQRLISDFYARQISIYSLLMPLSAVCYCMLLTVTMIRRLGDKKTLWKGREV